MFLQVREATNLEHPSVINREPALCERVIECLESTGLTLNSGTIMGCCNHVMLIVFSVQFINSFFRIRVLLFILLTKWWRCFVFFRILCCVFYDATINSFKSLHQLFVRVWVFLLLCVSLQGMCRVWFAEWWITSISWWITWSWSMWRMTLCCR